MVRYPELDIWRGLAVIGMIIFHILFFLDFYGFSDLELYQGWSLLFARVIQWSFLLLVGISLVLSSSHHPKKNDFFFIQTKKAVVIFACSLLITLGTWFVVPNSFVRFGVLHLIGSSILLLSVIADRPRVSLLTACFIFFMSSFPPAFTFPGKFIFWVVPFQTLDYFPIFPWMAIPALGIFLAHYVYGAGRSPISVSVLSKHIAFQRIAFLGRHALLIYMIHIPFLFVVMHVMQLIRQL